MSTSGSVSSRLVSSPASRDAVTVAEWTGDIMARWVTDRAKREVSQSQQKLLLSDFTFMTQLRHYVKVK